LACDKVTEEEFCDKVTEEEHAKVPFYKLMSGLFLRRTYRCSMGKFIGIGAGAVLEKNGKVKRFCGLVQLKEKKTKSNARLMLKEKKTKSNARLILKPQQASQPQSRREDG